METNGCSNCVPFDEIVLPRKQWSLMKAIALWVWTILSLIGCWGAYFHPINVLTGQELPRPGAWHLAGMVLSASSAVFCAKLGLWYAKEWFKYQWWFGEYRLGFSNGIAHCHLQTATAGYPRIPDLDGYFLKVNINLPPGMVRCQLVLPGTQERVNLKWKGEWVVGFHAAGRLGNNNYFEVDVWDALRYRNAGNPFFWKLLSAREETSIYMDVIEKWRECIRGVSQLSTPVEGHRHCKHVAMIKEHLGTNPPEKTSKLDLRGTGRAAYSSMGGSGNDKNSD